MRLDDVLNAGSWLITTMPVGEFIPFGLSCIGLDDQRLAPFRASIAAWLQEHGVAAVLVRPDRYIYGTGQPVELLRGWSQAMRAQP